jgi:hypothetical protein
MFIALYRWKIKEGFDSKFQEGWHRRTLEIYQKCGSLGSRLHRAEDGTWFGYAQWPDKATWETARDIPSTDAEARLMMRESIEHAFPDVYMSVVDDLLKTYIRLPD